MAKQTIRPGGLGRLPAPDVRDKLFLLPRPITLPATVRKTWDAGAGKAWDQGQTSQCVSYSTNRYLVASPVRNKPPMALDAFYRECQKNDEFPGEDYDGTSVRGAFKVLQSLGLVSEYRWGFDVTVIINQILTASPVVVGTDWTNAMFDPETHGKYRGFIRVAPDGQYAPVGGHAYLLIGVDRAKKCPDGTVGAFRLINSWGPSWGESGRAWLGCADFATLLAHNGEAAVAVEIKK